MLPFPMVGRIAPLSSPPVVPFQSFLPPNLLCACPSARRASVPLWQSNLSPLCFHTLTNCFSRNPFVFTLICVAQGCHPNSSVPARPSGGSPWQIHSFQVLAASLPSLSTSRPLFSATWSLFSQNTRVGGWSTLASEPFASQTETTMKRVLTLGWLLCTAFAPAAAAQQATAAPAQNSTAKANNGQKEGAKRRGTVMARTFVVTAPIC